MSAYIVGHDHIDALLTFAMGPTQRDFTDGVRYFVNGTAIEITRTNATEIGRTLLTENERSVRHRYPGCAVDDLPGTIGDAAEYEFRPFEGPTPLAILKACDCFDYQACETDDYESTLAHRIVDAIRKRAIMRLPGYDNSPGWEIARPEETHQE